MSCTRPPTPPVTVLAGILAFLAAISAGCATPAPVIVATDAVFPPFHEERADGTIDGYEIAMVRAALERAGVPAEIVKAPSYRALFDGLLAGEHDIVAASTGITPERQATYAMTEPTFTTCLAAVVRAEPGAPASVEALHGRRIAASPGTTSERAVRGLPGATFVPFEKGAASGVEDLRSGSVVAIVIDEFEAVAMAAEASDLRVMRTPVAQERYAFVLRRDDAKLRDRLNAALAELAADGTRQRLREAYGLARPAGWTIAVE